MAFKFNPFTGNFDIDNDSGGSAVGSKIGPVSIAASTSMDVDTNADTSFKGLRYFVTAWTATKTKSFDMTVIIEDGNIFDSLYAKVGRNLDVSVDVVQSGSDIILRVTNNEAVSMDVEVLKFFLGG